MSRYGVGLHCMEGRVRRHATPACALPSPRDAVAHALEARCDDVASRHSPDSDDALDPRDGGGDGAAQAACEAGNCYSEAVDYGSDGARGHVADGAHAAPEAVADALSTAAYAAGGEAAHGEGGDSLGRREVGGRVNQEGRSLCMKVTLSRVWLDTRGLTSQVCFCCILNNH